MKSKALILAAGKGERLVRGLAYPKPLKRVAGVPLIVRILRNLEKAGIEEVGVIVGYLGDVLIEGIERYRFGNMKIEYIWNHEWDKPNGTSLLKAKDFVDGPTFLMMSDHLWSPELLEAVGAFPLESDEAVLGVDYDIPACFDLDDATKVAVDGDRVASIGKEIPSYDCLDTGVFRITPALMHELERVNGPEGCSLSHGVGALARSGKMRIANVGTATWIDVDTPTAHVEAERLIKLYGDTLRPASSRTRSVSGFPTAIPLVAAAG